MERLTEPALMNDCKTETYIVSEDKCHNFLYGYNEHGVAYYQSGVAEKLGKLEDIVANADSIRIIVRDGVASLHIDMILDQNIYPKAIDVFGKEKVVEY